MLYTLQSLGLSHAFTGELPVQEVTKNEYVQATMLRTHHPTRPHLARETTLTPDCAPMLPHVIFSRLQVVKLAIIVQYYTPLQGQDTIVYGKIAVPVPAPPPSGAAINHLGLVGLRGKGRRSPAWLIVYYV